MHPSKYPKDEHKTIAIKKRNISFLAINALFRLKYYKVLNVDRQFTGSFIINGYVPLQPNDQLRKKAEKCLSFS